MATLVRARALSDRMRPAIPQWARVCEVVGTHFHDLLSGHGDPATVLRQTQAQADRLLNTP
jgi:hypothetical protein